MVTATAREVGAANRRGGVPFVLIVLALLSFAYAPFLFGVYMYPSMRDLGFGTLDEIRNKSVLFLGLVLLLTVYFWHRATPALGVRAQTSAKAQVQSGGAGGKAVRGVRVA